MRLLGFPIHVRSGFFFALLLVFATGARQNAVAYAVAYAGFMVVHELGHAWVARRFGADNISISLDFLIGYASFVPPRGISRARLALISVAGPAVEIVVGIVVLVAMGANPLSLDSVTQGVRWPVFFLGPILGLFNLLPILPLDGGNIAALGVESFAPSNGRRYYRVASLVVCALLVVAALSSNRYRFVAYTFGMLAVMNYLALRAPRSSAHSPWDAPADVAAALQGIGLPLPLTDGIDPAHLDATLASVADPMPVENQASAEIVHGALHQLGYLKRAAEYGARLYARHPSSATATLVAEELRLLGFPDAAAAWRAQAQPAPWAPPNQNGG